MLTVCLCGDTWVLQNSKLISLNKPFSFFFLNLLMTFLLVFNHSLWHRSVKAIMRQHMFGSLVIISWVKKGQTLKTWMEISKEKPGVSWISTRDSGEATLSFSQNSTVLIRQSVNSHFPPPCPVQWSSSVVFQWGEENAHECILKRMKNGH